MVKIDPAGLGRGTKIFSFNGSLGNILFSAFFAFDVTVALMRYVLGSLTYYIFFPDSVLDAPSSGLYP